MKVFIDSVPRTREALNSVLVVIPDPVAGDRHLTITHEGVVIDIVRDGAVDGSCWMPHEEMFHNPEDEL